MNKRKSIPLNLKRQVLIKAGHRCAIPSCRHPTTEIAHIVPWNKCKKHTFENLIALCPNCHTRYDNNQIERKAMLIYKRNLSILNSRYSDLEIRVLKFFANNFPDKKDCEILIARTLNLLLLYLLEDGIMIDMGPASNKFFPIVGLDPHSHIPIAENLNQYNRYKLTDQGIMLVEKWKIGEEIE